MPKFGETGARYNHALGHDFVPFREQLEAMAELHAAGKIRAWGVSNETTYGVATFCALARELGLPKPVSIQNDYSLCDRRFETELAECCAPQHEDVGLVAYGVRAARDPRRPPEGAAPRRRSPGEPPPGDARPQVLCGGTLAGKYSFGRVPPTDARHRNMPGFQSRYTSGATLKAAEEYEALFRRRFPVVLHRYPQVLAKDHGMTVLELALASCYSRPFLSTAILGARDPRQRCERARLRP